MNQPFPSRSLIDGSTPKAPAPDPSNFTTIRITAPNITIFARSYAQGSRITLERDKAKRYTGGDKPVAVAERDVDLQVLPEPDPPMIRPFRKEGLEANWAARRVSDAREARKAAALAVDRAATFADVPLQAGEFDPASIVGRPKAAASKAG